MKKVNWTLAMLFAATSLMTAPLALAQQTTLGTFNLPMEARFGGKILQPGEYTVARIDRMDALRIKGDGGTAIILASSIAPQPDSEHSRLTLASVNGGFALKGFESGVLGLKFNFATPKPVNKEWDRASVAQPSSVDIALK